MIFKEFINHFWEKKLIRFLFVGGLNTLFGYIVFALGIFIGLHYSLATFFSIAFGILFNFKTTGSIVFKNHDNKLIFKFFAVYLVSYSLNVFFLYIFNILKISNYIGGLILILPMALMSFILQKKFVFIEKEES